MRETAGSRVVHVTPDGLIALTLSESAAARQCLPPREGRSTAPKTTKPPDPGGGGGLDRRGRRDVDYLLGTCGMPLAGATAWPTGKDLLGACGAPWGAATGA